MTAKDIKPMADYCLVEVMQKESGVVKSGDIRDSMYLGRKGKVLAVGPGVWNHAGTERIKPSAKVGDIVFWEEAAEANTPPEVKEIKGQKLALIKDIRFIASVKE